MSVGKHPSLLHIFMITQAPAFFYPCLLSQAAFLSVCAEGCTHAAPPCQLDDAALVPSCCTRPIVLRSILLRLVAVCRKSHRLLHKQACSGVHGLSCAWLIRFSYDNTNHSTVAVVDDFLHGFLEFYLAFVADHGDFVGDAVVDELFHGFSEDVGLPDAVLVVSGV